MRPQIIVFFLNLLSSNPGLRSGNRHLLRRPFGTRFGSIFLRRRNNLPELRQILGPIRQNRPRFRRYGNWVVLLGRVIPGIRTYISIPAGLENMPLFPFLLYSTWGTILWIGFLTVIGYWLGDNYTLVKQYTGPISTAVLVILLIGAGIWFYRRQKKSM